MGDGPRVGPNPKAEPSLVHGSLNGPQHTARKRPGLGDRPPPGLSPSPTAAK